jgi:vacuolar protein sorting-associated protein 13A/C
MWNQSIYAGFRFLTIEVFYRYKQVELLIIEKDMFIGTVLKSLEIEDLVCRNRGSRPCFLARSFIGNADANSSSYDVEDQNFDGNNVTPSEGDDKFYEAPENLIDSVNHSMQSPSNKSEYPGSQNLHRSEILSLKPPSFSRIAGLLPTDAFQTRRQDIELTDTLDSFVKAQIIIYDQNSPRYSNIDNQVGIFCA